MGERFPSPPSPPPPPPAAVSNSFNLSPQSHCQRCKNQSEVWDHFTKEPRKHKKARCNHYTILMNFEGGTSSLLSHSKKCRKSHNSSSSSLGQGGHVSASPSLPIFDQEICQTELVKLFVSLAIPFRWVKHEAFTRFLYVLQPKFRTISRSTLARDVLVLCVTSQF
ncbi:hypothetical protein RJT34_12929 [Clitoria ternatea]|uniref:BED-type domain-containing protein n=1 Tax=Clitoria ternatea TaxID=43366 RepID=A0AAN9JMQ0_CLITE